MAEGTEVIQSLSPLLLLYFSGSLFSLCSSFCLPLPSPSLVGEREKAFIQVAEGQ